MDIKLLSGCCAKITVDADECRAMGISYLSFSPDSVSARIFLASLLARLEAMGAAAAKSSRITAEIFEQTDKSLVIYICGMQMQDDPEDEDNCSDRLRVIAACDPRRLAEAADELPDDTQCELFAFDGKYYLFFEGGSAGQPCDRVFAAKIKEYGKRLSDAPLKKLRGL